ncbi:MAG: NifB/NifX family molybdenum-iron cluster-binding protein [Burkholderiaceae bacterium]|nr:NifB/NifX family molybdenum-iron cluster-binding protein [Burkholderiaceae bacterium]
MKIAFSTAGDTLESPFNSTFGRAPKFLIYDLERRNFEVIDNRQNLNAAQGAGVKSAQTIAKSGVQCLISGHCGPKAFRVLSAAGIKVYYCNAPTVVEALTQFDANALTAASSADVNGHHG